MSRGNSPSEVMLRNVRLSYPALYKAKGFGDGSEGEPKFSAVALLDPEDKQGQINIGKIEDAIDFVKKEKWPKGAPKLGPSKICLKDSEDLEEMKDGYEGMMYLTASDAKRPRILDADGIDVREGDDGAPYAGCFVDMKVRIWAQDNKFGKRINGSLVAVKFRDDGDAFGAAPFDPSEFDDEDDDGGSSRSSRSSRRGRDDDDGERGRGGRSGRRSRDDDGDEDEGRSRRSSRRSSRDDEGDDEGESRSRRSSRRGRDDEGDDEGESRSRRSSRRGRDDEEDDEGESRSRRSSRRGRDDDGDEEEEDEGRSRRSSRRDRDEEDDERPSRRNRRDLA